MTYYYMSMDHAQADIYQIYPYSIDLKSYHIMYWITQEGITPDAISIKGLSQRDLIEQFVCSIINK